jgi:hypothetical protein
MSLLLAQTDDSGMSALAPLLEDKRTRYAHCEFCRICPEQTQGCIVRAAKIGHPNQPQSTHSSTRASSSGGNETPKFLSTVRFALIANWVGPAIGKSAGFAPCRILST